MQATNNDAKLHQYKLLNNPILLIFNTIALFFVSQFVASFVVIFVQKFSGGETSQSLNTSLQFIYVVTADLLILFGVRMFLRKKGQTLKSVGMSKPQMSDVGKALLAYAGYLVIFMLTTIIAKKVSPSLNVDQQQQLGFEANKGLVNLVLAGISLVILPPIVEETLCRGYLYTGLRSRYKIIPSAIITSIVFASAHLQFGSNAPLLWIAAIDTFVLSLVLVYLREKTDRLAASMILHGIKNMIAFSLLFIFMK